MAVKIFLDTNAIIELLNENSKVIQAIAQATDIYISIINELEFKSFKGLSMNDTNLFDDFANMVTVLDLKVSDRALKDKIIEIRNLYKIKLPDAIIAASAIMNEAELITADKGFSKVKGLKLKLIV